MLTSLPEQSIDSLKESNATLAAECESYRQRNGRLQDKVDKYDEKLDAVNRDLRHSKNDLKHAKDEIKRLLAELHITSGAKETLEKACKQLRYEKETAENAHTRLKASYENLRMKYDAIPEERRNPMTAPKRTGTASATSGGSGGSSRAQQESERGRAARRQAEKERLGARFETTKRPPPSGGNRSSYIEGFGSSRRRSGSAAAPTTRVMYDVAHTRHYDDPIVTPRESVAFSTPRRIPSNGGYHSGGSSTVISDEYDDGDYHIHPIH